jgi:hypothetical protein
MRTTEYTEGTEREPRKGRNHQLSKKHLARYLHEFSFRWDPRRTSDGERMVVAIGGAEGRR